MSEPEENPLPEEQPAQPHPLEAEVAALKDQLLRTLADGENTRRRLEKEKEESNKYAVQQFAREMLQVADNLRRAIEAAGTDAALKNFLVGIEATERQLLGGFGKFGIKLMEPMGKPFDANFHQVMLEVESNEKPGTVVQVMQAGYTLNDRLLRPALVGVAKAASKPVDQKA